MIKRNSKIIAISFHLSKAACSAQILSNKGHEYPVLYDVHTDTKEEDCQ